MTNKELQQQIEQLEQLEQQIKDLKVKLEEECFLPYVPYEVEVPEDIDDYYYTNEYGRVDYLGGYNTSYEKNKYIRGLAFKTKEEAEKYDKERILLFKLRKWAEEHNGGWTPNWKESDNKFFICYFHNSGSFHVKDTWHANDFHKLPYFKSEEIAEQFIEEFGDEIKEVLC